MTRKGRKLATRGYKALARLIPEPDLVVYSEATRARQTAKVLLKRIGRVRSMESALLNPGAQLRDLQKLIKAAGTGVEYLVLVGHEPDFSDIINHLVSDGTLALKIRKGACIEVDVQRGLKGSLCGMFSLEALAGADC